jgi:hypothetical protein
LLIRFVTLQLIDAVSTIVLRLRRQKNLPHKKKSVSALFCVGAAEVGDNTRNFCWIGCAE